MSSPLTVEIDHALAIITFNNPARANALDLAMAQAFAAAIEQVAGVVIGQRLQREQERATEQGSDDAE